MTTRDFNREAAHWDEQPGRIKMADELFAALVRHVPLTPQTDAFEFGCGTGLITMRLQPQVRRIVGVDSSEGMLAQLAKKITAARAANIETRLVDLAKGDRLEGQYDLVVISMVLHHIPVLAEIFAQFHRILRPDGRLAILDLDPEDGSFHSDPTGIFHNGFDREALARELVATGFANVTFTLATEIVKEKEPGRKRVYSIFLAVASKDATAH
jgi:ubiquinone/menaquinone biosynthesis C-methylase UbiE